MKDANNTDGEENDSNKDSRHTGEKTSSKEQGNDSDNLTRQRDKENENTEEQKRDSEKKTNQTDGETSSQEEQKSFLSHAFLKLVHLINIPVSPSTIHLICIAVVITTVAILFIFGLHFIWPFYASRETHDECEKCCKPTQFQKTSSPDFTELMGKLEEENCSFVELIKNLVEDFQNFEKKYSEDYKAFDKKYSGYYKTLDNDIQSTKDETERVKKKHGEEFKDIYLYIFSFLILLLLVILIIAINGRNGFRIVKRQWGHNGFSLSENNVNHWSQKESVGGIGIISFDRQTEAFHEKMFQRVTVPRSILVKKYVVASSQNLNDLRKHAIFLIFVDSNDRDIILENPETEIGNVRRITTEYTMDAECDVFLIYCKDKRSRSLQNDQLYGAHLRSTTQKPILSELIKRERFFSADDAFNRQQVKLLEDCMKQP